MARRTALLLAAALMAPAASAGAARRPAPPRDRTPVPLKDLARSHKVRLVYFVPADRKPTGDWAGKIEVLMTFVSDLYRTGLADSGHQTRGLDFEFDEAGSLRVHLVRGARKAAHYSGAPDYTFRSQWRTILPAVENAHGPAGQTVYVIFAETYDSIPHKFEWAGGVALGARMSARGGAAVFSAWVLQDMFCATTVGGQMKLLADKTRIKGRKALGSGKPDSPRFEFIEDGFGAVAHELGHALGLPHDHRKDWSYIMGNGFRRLGANYLGAAGRKPVVTFSPENARMLAHCAYLSAAHDPADRKPPTVTVTVPDELPAGTTSLEIAVHATDDKALASLVCFSSHGDTVKWGRELTGKAADVTQTITFPPVRKGSFRIETTVIDRGGNIRRADRTITVTAAAPGRDRPATDPPRRP